MNIERQWRVLIGYCFTAHLCGCQPKLYAVRIRAGSMTGGDFDDVLIAEVEKYSHLYDITSKNYRDAKMAELSWISIAETCGRSPKECKDRWRYLRDQYVKRRKTFDENGGAEMGAKRQKWRYFDALGFLSDFIKHRVNENFCFG